MANGNDLAVGGLGLGTTFDDIIAAPSTQLALAPDLQPTTSIGAAPSSSSDIIYRGMYNPLSPIGRPSTPAATNFDLGFGDSIAGQQLHSNIPGVGQGRMWGYLGPQYDANNPAPFDIWQTAGVGDPPQRILDRAKYMLAQNPDYFRGKNMFLTIGSNDPGQIDATKELFKTLDEAGVGKVVVPGMGPKVPDSAVMNKALQSAVEGAGSNFSFFQPDIRWAGDGVHPANSKQMFDQANAALNRMLPSPSPDSDGGLQPGGALQPPAPPPINPLVPMVPTGGQPIYPTWGDFIRAKEGGPLLSIGDDVGFGSIGYGHLVTDDMRGKPFAAVDEAGKQYSVPYGNITHDQAEDIFRKDIGDSINAWRKEIPNFDSLTGLQKEALVSYQYNTGKTIPGMPEAIAAGDFNKAAELLRNGISTRQQRLPDGTVQHNIPSPELAARREQEAQMMLGHEVPAYGYVSGQRVPHSPYAVGGRAVPTTPSQYMPSPVMASNPFAVVPPGATQSPAQDLAQINQREKMMQALQMWSVLRGLAQGVKFTPVSYDPFKVQEAGKLGPGFDSGRIPPVEPIRPMASTVSPAAAASPNVVRQQVIQGITDRLGGVSGGIARGRTSVEPWTIG